MSQFLTPSVEQFIYNGTTYENKPINIGLIKNFYAGVDYRRDNLPAIYFVSSNNISILFWVYATIADRDADLVNVKNAAGSGGSGTGSATLYQFTIGDGQSGTPVANSTQYTNTGMASANNTNCKVQLNGYGFIVVNIDFTFKSGGGITLINNRVFDDSTTYTIFLFS